MPISFCQLAFVSPLFYTFGNFRNREGAIQIYLAQSGFLKGRLQALVSSDEIGRAA